MARDAMRTLRSVRQRAVEEARQALGVCLKAEADLATCIAALDDAAQRDRDAHPAVEQAHQFMDMFTLRIRTNEAERRTLEAALASAQARSAEARNALVAARTGAEVVETLITQRRAADAAAANLAEQHALDDMARTGISPALLEPDAC